MITRALQPSRSKLGLAGIVAVTPEGTVDIRMRTSPAFGPVMLNFRCAVPEPSFTTLKFCVNDWFTRCSPQFSSRGPSSASFGRDGSVRA